jgi:flagellar L-ring protein precursor FlgH
MIRLLVLLLLVIIFSGCTNAPPKPDPAFSSVRPVMSQPLPNVDGAIYRSGYEMSLFEDKRAKRVGDIITVLLLEKTQASKSASTSTSKDSSIDIGTPSLYGGPVTHIGKEILSAAADAERSFTGEGDSTQSNSLNGQIAVTVVQVLPNGNLMVRGEKLLTLNQGSERIQLSGIIRQSDVGADNTVASTQVADAQIIYAGEGALADANSPGWLTRFFTSGWWPF